MSLDSEIHNDVRIENHNDASSGSHETESQTAQDVKDALGDESDQRKLAPYASPYHPGGGYYYPPTPNKYGYDYGYDHLLPPPTPKKYGYDYGHGYDYDYNSGKGKGMMQTFEPSLV